MAMLVSALENVVPEESSVQIDQKKKNSRKLNSVENRNR